jgi:DHA2 family multidrug resistance protein
LQYCSKPLRLPCGDVSKAAVVRSARALSDLQPQNKWLVTASVGFGALMGTIDSSIVNVALPHIRGSVGATIQEITWISTAYVIAAVMVMPLTGFLGSLFGQKQVYMASLVLFVVGSALCGSARSLPMLVLCRTMQGFGAGALQPTQQAILRQTFPLREQGMAMAMFAMVIMIGPAVGPTLGGWITDNYSWPWIFYINLPIGLLGLLMVWRFVHEPEDIRAANRARAAAQRGHMDWAGIAFLCLGVAMLQYVLEQGQDDDWFESRTIVACSFAAAVAFAALVVRELTATQPAVDLRLFRDRTFAAGTLIGGVQFAMLMGSMFLLPVFMEELLGYDATDSGIALMPRTAIMIVVVPIVGLLYNHVAPALIVALGVINFAVGSLELSHLTLASGERDIIRPMLVTGVGFSCLFVPLTTTALSNIPRHKLTDAAGLNSFVRQFSGSLGLAVFTTLLTRYATAAKASIGAHVCVVCPEALQRLAQFQSALAGRGMSGGVAGTAALGLMQGSVAKQAMMLAFEKTFLLQGITFLAVLPLLYFLRVNREGPSTALPVAGPTR